MLHFTSNIQNSLQYIIQYTWLLTSIINMNLCVLPRRHIKQQLYYGTFYELVGAFTHSVFFLSLHTLAVHLLQTQILYSIWSRNDLCIIFFTLYRVKQLIVSGEFCRQTGNTISFFFDVNE